MPLTVRVIACLDVADGRVVKGTNFADLKDAGDPIALAEKYYREGIDELTLLDVNASKENRSTMIDLVRKTAETVFIPLTVGGGISSVAQVADLLAAGADKVSLSSAALANPDLISQIADRYGSQVLVLSMDLKRNESTPSGFVATSHGGSQDTGVDGLEWALTAQNLGAGELLVNSIDRDGTRDGFDIEMLSKIVKLSHVPVVASGGAGKPEDFQEVAAIGVDAVLAAGIFHRDEVGIAQVKEALQLAGHQVRGAA